MELVPHVRSLCEHDMMMTRTRAELTLLMAAYHVSGICLLNSIAEKHCPCGPSGLFIQPTICTSKVI